MPLAKRQLLGAHGEALAIGYLHQLGYQILAQNWRCRYGEIDVVARDGDHIVFVEVRTRRANRGYDPLESVDRRKQVRLQQSAQSYLGERALGEQPWRIDLIAITLRDGVGAEIAHVRAAVEE